MLGAKRFSTQHGRDSDQQCRSGSMPVGDRVERDLESSAHVLPANPVVLVVDDDPALRESLVRMLAECDLLAIGATSSLDALRILQQSHVDVVVVDQFTWGIDGVGLLSDVRQRWPHVQRILFMSEAAPDVVIDAVNRGGVQKVILKNMHAVQIRDEIERVSLGALGRRG